MQRLYLACYWQRNCSIGMTVPNREGRGGVRGQGRRGWHGQKSFEKYFWPLCVQVWTKQWHRTIYCQSPLKSMTWRERFCEDSIQVCPSVERAQSGIPAVCGGVGCSGARPLWGRGKLYKWASPLQPTLPIQVLGSQLFRLLQVLSMKTTKTRGDQKVLQNLQKTRVDSSESNQGWTPATLFGLYLSNRTGISAENTKWLSRRRLWNVDLSFEYCCIW